MTVSDFYRMFQDYSMNDEVCVNTPNDTRCKIVGMEMVEGTLLLLTEATVVKKDGTVRRGRPLGCKDSTKRAPYKTKKKS